MLDDDAMDDDGVIVLGVVFVFPTNPPADAQIAVPADQFALAFRMLDVDGDGALDAKEFEHMMKLMRDKHPQGRQVRDKNVLGEAKGRLESLSGVQHLFGTWDARAWSTICALGLLRLCCSDGACSL